MNKVSKKYQINKVSKKYQIRKLKKTNLYKNKYIKKTNINKSYQLSGGFLKNAKALFFKNFDKIKPYLIQEKNKGYITDIKPKEMNDKINNNFNIIATKVNSKGQTHIDTSHINTLFDNIIRKLKNITSEFFLKTEKNKEEDYETYEQDDDVLDKFRTEFINDNIEWIINCYINSNFYLISNATSPTNATLPNNTTFREDNLLFKNYKLFLKLYTQLKFLLDNSGQLLVLIKRAIIQIKRILKEPDVKNNNQRLNDKQQKNIEKLRNKYKDILNLKSSKKGYYILGTPPIQPFFNSLFELNDFINEYKTEIHDIKEFIINAQLKKNGEGPPHVEIVVDAPFFYIYKILDKGASIYYGSNTSWCTATKSSLNMFKSYSERGDIYIIQAKDEVKDEDEDKDEVKNIYKLQKSSDKYQLQLNTQSLMNNKDQPISLTDLFDHFNEPKLVDFVKELCKDTKIDSIYKYTNNDLDLDIDLKSMCHNFFINDITITNKNIKKLSLTNFDKPLSDLLNGIDLHFLSINGNFNQPLGDSLNGLTALNNLSFYFSNNFNQLLGDSLINLTKLQTLRLEGAFNQPLGDSLNGLTNLQTLNLGGKFNQLFGDSLINLTNLQTLSFSFNSDFNQLLGDSLIGLTALKKLNFKGKFNQLLGNSLEHLTQLQSLSFEGDFDQPFENSLKNLEKLTVLKISGKFNKKFETSLNNLTNLKTLEIGGSYGTTQLFNQPLDNSLDNLVNLETLQIYNGEFTQKFGSSLDNLIRLKRLSVANIYDPEPFSTNLKKRGIKIQ